MDILIFSQIIRSILKSIPFAGGIEELTFGTFSEIKKRDLNKKTELFKENVLKGIEKLISNQNSIIDLIHIYELQRNTIYNSFNLKEDIEKLKIPTKSKIQSKGLNDHSEEIFNEKIRLINNKLDKWFNDTRTSLEYILKEKEESYEFQGSTNLKDYIIKVSNQLTLEKSVKNWFVSPRWFIDCGAKKCEVNFKSCKTKVVKVKVEKYVSNWLSKNKQLLVILGDYGLGKTTLVKKIALELTKNKQLKKGMYFPFLIQFKNYSNSGNLGSIFKDFLYEHNFSINSFFSNINFVIPIFILDGFDEISSSLDKSLSLLSLTDLTKAMPSNAKIILTSRTHFFKTKEEEIESIVKISYMFNDNSINLLESQETIYLENFDNNKVELYTKNRLKKEYNDFNDKISKVYNLKDLITRPILADLICNEWKYLTNKVSVTIFDLYTIIVENWINRENWRNIKKEEIFFFLEILAIKMLENKQLSYHHQELTKYISHHIKNKYNILKDINTFDSNIRTCTFIYRDMDGNYIFMHKSFWEYFVARGIIHSLNKPKTNFNFRFWEEPYSNVITEFIRCQIDKNKLWCAIERIQPAITVENLNNATSLFVIYYDLGFYDEVKPCIDNFCFWDHLIGKINNLFKTTLFVDTNSKNFSA